MGFMTRRQIASGIALVISALCVVLLKFGRHSDTEVFFGIVLVCGFAFLFLTRTEEQKASGDTPWWW